MDVYRTADKRILELLTGIIKRLNRYKGQINTKSDTLAIFDELHVLYKQIDRESRNTFLEILQNAYDAESETKRRRFDEAFINIMLDDEPNEFTGVIYGRELERRAERFAERIVSALNRSLQQEQRTDQEGAVIPLGTEIKAIFDQEYSGLSLLLDQYGIVFVDEGRVAAFADDSVSSVMWITQIDGRECRYCKSLNRHVFRADKVPTKPHPRCRCYTIRFK